MAPSRTRILIVDDSAVMRSLLRAVVSADPALEVAGTAADGESALTAVSTLRPDLMLLDVEMPVMDGLTTLRTSPDWWLQNAGDHVQRTHTTRRPCHRRSTCCRRFGLRRQTKPGKLAVKLPSRRWGRICFPRFVH